MHSKKVNKLPHICWNVITRTKYLEIQKTISILLKNSTCGVTLYVWTFKFTLINPWSVLVITLHDTVPWGVLPLFYNASWKFCHFYMICCDLPITWNIFSNSMKIFWLKLIFTYLSQFLHNLDQLYWCGFLNGQLLSTVYSSYSVVLYHNSISTLLIQLTLQRKRWTGRAVSIYLHSGVFKLSGCTFSIFFSLNVISKLSSYIKMCEKRVKYCIWNIPQVCRRKGNP